jgi:hypothetical protein
MDESLLPREIAEGGVGTWRLGWSGIYSDNEDSMGYGERRRTKRGMMGEKRKGADGCLYTGIVWGNRALRTTTPEQSYAPVRFFLSLLKSHMRTTFITPGFRPGRS